MKRFLRAISAFCLSALPLAAQDDPLSATIGSSGSVLSDTALCVLRVQVTFVVPWMAESFLATNPGDPDGPAIFMSNPSGKDGPPVLKDLSPGDILEVTGRQTTFQSGPGVTVSDAHRIWHEDLPPPRERSIHAIRSGLLNNRRAPFDPQSVSGPEDGHFGLSSMRERAVRAGLKLTFTRKRRYQAVVLEKEQRK